MNSYATEILRTFLVLAFLVITLHIGISFYIGGRLSGMKKLLALLGVVVGIMVLWSVVVTIAAFYFAFCSGCFGPGSPQEQVFMWTFSLPFSSTGVVLVPSTLYLLAVLCSSTLVRLNRRILLVPILGLLAMVLTAIPATIAVERVVSNPNGSRVPVPTNARQVSEERISVLPHITYITPDSPQTVFTFYAQALPQDGWVPLYDYTGPTPVPMNVYWRVTVENREIYLRIKAEKKIDNEQTYVEIGPGGYPPGQP